MKMLTEIPKRIKELANEERERDAIGSYKSDLGHRTDGRRDISYAFAFGAPPCVVTFNRVIYELEAQ